MFNVKNVIKHFINSLRAAKSEFYKQKKYKTITKINKLVIDSLLNSQSPIRLELGASNQRIKGWLAVDLMETSDICLNLLCPLPFPDNSVTEIYSSHLLEHFYYPDLINLLSECHRILKSGGRFSAAVPNARIYVEAYFNPEQFDANAYCVYKPGFNYNSKIDYVNYIAYMGGHHRFMFDEENLLIILNKAGFRDARLREFNPGLDLEERKNESIYAEGVK